MDSLSQATGVAGQTVTLSQGSGFLIPQLCSLSTQASDSVESCSQNTKEEPDLTAPPGLACPLSHAESPQVIFPVIA